MLRMLWFVKEFLFYVLTPLILVCHFVGSFFIDVFCTSYFTAPTTPIEVKRFDKRVPYRDPDKVWLFKSILVCTAFGVVAIVLAVLFN